MARTSWYRDRVRTSLALVLGVAVLVRALTWSALLRLPVFRTPDVDAAIYHRAAQQIAGGDLSMGGEVLRMSPGYFYWLGGLYALLGDGRWGFRLVQALLGLLLVGLIWDCTRRLLGMRWALWAGLCAAAYGPLAFYETAQLSDAVGAAFHGLLLWLVVVHFGGDEGRARPGLRAVALIGLAWGACSALRPNALLLGLPLAWLCVQGAASLRQRAAALAVLAGGFACVVAPFTVHNYVVAGERVLLTAHGGIALYMGNGPGATGTFHLPDEIRDQAALAPVHQFDIVHAEAERALGRTLTAREADGYWYDKTKDAIRRDPLRWASLMLKKLRLFWNGREFSDVYDYEFYRRLDARIAASLSFAHVAALGLLGTILLLGQRNPAARFIGLSNVIGSLAVALVFVSGRYRLAVVPGAIVAAVFALAFIAERLRARRWRALAPLAAGAALCLAVAWPVRLKRSFDDEEYFKLAASYHAHGELADAERAYLQSLQLNPRHEGSRHNLAVLYARTGRADAAQQLRRGDARPHGR